MATSYVKDDEGGTFIPASQRPDGTWRKLRRVKDGYVPQEEVPLYESKGKHFTKNQPAYPVGMSEEYVAAHKAKQEAVKSSIPGLVIQPETKKKKKKSKNKSVASLGEDLAKTTITEPEAPKKVSIDNKSSNQKSKGSEPAAKEAVNAAQPTAVDPVKRLKNLKKKLREIESLDQKIKTGEIKNPEKEVLDKVSRKAEVKREIKRLETNQ